MEIHPWCGSKARKPPKRLGDGPMFCKVSRIVFTLFFLILLGSQFPVSLGPMVWLLNHVFCFYWAPSTLFLRDQWFGCSACFLLLLGSKYPVSSGPIVPLLILLY